LGACRLGAVVIEDGGCGLRVMWHAVSLQMRTLSSTVEVWQSPAVRKMRGKGGGIAPFIRWFCALIGAGRWMGRCVGSTPPQTKRGDK